MKRESIKQREQRLGYNQMFYYEGNDDPYDEEKEEEVLEFCPDCHSKPCSCSDNI